MRAPGKRFGGAVLLPQGHQAGHFVLGQPDFLAAPIGQRHIGHFIGHLCGDLWHDDFSPVFLKNLNPL